MSILNTARSVYAMNEDKGLIGSVGTAINAHTRAALHPTNMIGRMFGFGSFIHTFAERKLGSPRYLPGGVKNYAKAGVKGLGGSSAAAAGAAARSQGASSASGGGSVVVKQLGRIEENTGHTVGLLTRVIEGDRMNATKADIRQDFEEENAAEQNRLFQSMADKLEKLSVKPMGAASSAAGGNSTMWDVFKGMALERVGELILGGLATVIGGIFSYLGVTWLASKIAGFASGIMMGARSLFLTIFKRLGLGFLGVIGSIGNGIFEGIKAYQETGSLKAAIPAMLSGMTLGLLSPEFIENWFLKPLTGALDYIFQGILGGMRSLGDSVYDWLERNLGSHNPFGSTKPKLPPPVTDISPRALNNTMQADQLAAEYTKNKNSTSVAVGGGTMTWDIPGSGGSTSVKAGGGAMTWDIPNTTKVTPIAAPKFVAGGRAGLEPVGISSNIPADGRRLLSAISGSESKMNSPDAYTMINSGGNFSDFSDHPFASTNRKTGYGLAAGKYQFMPATWNEYKAKLGLKDFSPASQDAAAWALAKDRYRTETGNNLEADLKDPSKAMQISRGLSKTWTSLPGGREINTQSAKFVARLNGGIPELASAAPVMAGAAPKFPVADATATTQAAARQTAAVRQETDLTAATGASSYAAHILNRNLSEMRQTKATTPAPAMPPAGSLDDAVDDIVAKILVAMGAVSQT
jgi:muramidase (phage lysozyme)